MAEASLESNAVVSCLICGAENSDEAVVCSECYAPLALIEQAVRQDRDPCIVTVIGDSNVGKTVYLGFLLDMLAKRAGDFEAVPKGAYSVNLQQNVIHHIGNRRFPGKTPNEVDQWNWAYYQVARRGNGASGSRWFDLVMPDMAGEALAAEVESPRTYQVIGNLLQKSAGALLLVDAGVASMGNPQPDFFAMKLLTYMDHLFAHKRSEKAPNPVAIVLCKADYCPQAFDDPRTFARTNLNRTWNLCDSRFAKVSFFATSVVGSLGFVTDEANNVISIPLHAAPCGILEPFEWVLANL